MATVDQYLEAVSLAERRRKALDIAMKGLEKAYQAMDALGMEEADAACKAWDDAYRLLVNDGMSETRAQLDELAQQAEGSHRQHMEGSDG